MTPKVQDILSRYSADMLREALASMSASESTNVFATGGDTDDEYYDIIPETTVTATLPSIKSRDGVHIAKNMAQRVSAGQMSIGDVPRKYQSYVNGEVKGAIPMTKFMNEQAWKIPAAALAVPGSVIGGAELAAAAPAVAAELKASAPFIGKTALRMVRDVPAFEVMDRLPTLWGDERISMKGGDATQWLADNTVNKGGNATISSLSRLPGEFAAGILPGVAGDVLMHHGASILPKLFVDLNNSGSGLRSKKSGLFGGIELGPRTRSYIKDFLESRKAIGTKYKEQIKYEDGAPARNSDATVSRYYRDIVDKIAERENGDGFFLESDFLDTRHIIPNDTWNKWKRKDDGFVIDETGVAYYPANSLGTTKVHEFRHQRDPEVFDVNRHAKNLAAREQLEEVIDTSSPEYATQFINQTPISAEQRQILKKAYPGVKDGAERAAVNRELGYYFYDAYNRIHGKYPNLEEYENFINSLGKYDVLEGLGSDVGYVNFFVDGLKTALSKQHANDIKRSLLKVPSLAAPVGIGAALVGQPASED